MATEPGGKLRARGPGRPRMAASTSQLPATTVPTPVHDAVARVAVRNGVSVASVIRDAIVSHLKNRQDSTGRVA